MTKSELERILGKIPMGWEQHCPVELEWVEWLKLMDFFFEGEREQIFPAIWPSQEMLAVEIAQKWRQGVWGRPSSSFTLPAHALAGSSLAAIILKDGQRRGWMLNPLKTPKTQRSLIQGALIYLSPSDPANIL